MASDSASAPSTAPSAATERHGAHQQAPRSWSVAFGFLGAPIAWLVHLVAASALVPVACEVDSHLVVHATTAITAVVAVAGIVLARRNGSRAAGQGHIAFLSTAGFWLGILFLALIILEGLPVFVLDPCE
jgi:hypothetical protein